MNKTVIEKSRGRATMLYNNNKFCMGRQRNIKKEWRCSKRRWLGCKAMIMTIEDEIVLCNDIHNHE